MTITTIEHGKPRAKPNIKLLAVIVVAIILTVSWAVLGHRYSSNTIAYQVGTSLVISGVVWAVAFFTFFRRDRIRNLGRYFFCLLFIAALVPSLAMSAKPTVYQDMVQDRRDYQHEITGLGAGLAPADVAGDPTLAQARFKAQRAIEIVAKYRALADKRLAEAGNPGRNQALVEEGWSYEAQAADRELQMIDLLIANRSGWAVQNNTFTFFNADLLKKYNADILAIQDIAKKGDAVRNQISGSNSPVAP